MEVNGRGAERDGGERGMEGARKDGGDRDNRREGDTCKREMGRKEYLTTGQIWHYINWNFRPQLHVTTYIINCINGREYRW
jgi:hypothetical protein